MTSETETSVGLARQVSKGVADLEDALATESTKKRGFWRRLRRNFSIYVFTSLTRRIVFLNVAALLVLVSGILYLNQFREGLIDARVESLLTQGEIIAGAIAASATVETNALTIDPEKLLELQAGESAIPAETDNDNLDFPIDPERVAPVLRRLISPTRTRARIYDRDGLIILDSKHLYTRGQVLRFDLPEIDPQVSWSEWFSKQFNTLLQRSDLPLYKEFPNGNGTGYPEVVTALTGSPGSVTRLTEDGELIVSVAVPVQRFRAVLGVLLLSTEAGDIDKIVQAERIGIVRVFMVAAGVTIILSILLASTIAQPLRRLAAAAVQVRLGHNARAQIPDFSDRRDEIGNLSTALRDMTASLYARIDAIESFAADVSHELKNPLTSLRSAVETLPLTKTDEQRKRLMDVIQHDVVRLDRLITDISDASRLDAELAREAEEPVDLEELLKTFKSAQDHINPGTSAIKLSLNIEKPKAARRLRGGSSGRTEKASRHGPFVTCGHELRLSQVINNLVDNARSFVPEKSGQINISLRRSNGMIEMTIEDNGPGIRAERVERIFERFYTDRTEQDGFGQNSGLGLSISKQIIEAQDGTLTAENIGGDANPEGARFIVRLPALQEG
ncbi:MAG: sensor histidine kinase [Pseudomonadota bacterium]